MLRSPFVGRERYLASFQRRLDMIARDGRGAGVAVRGRRQVGKSRLVEHFCEQSRLPYMYFQADRNASSVASIAQFLQVLAESGFENAHEAAEEMSWTWRAALQTLASVLPDDQPSIVVIDELPWLLEQDSALEGVLQTEWDRRLSKKPMLLILVGSDMRMMAAFSGYDRPYFGRADPMVVNPLDPQQVATMTGQSGVSALDAFLITGGFPGLCRAWPDGMPPKEFIQFGCSDANSPLFTMGEVMLASEFPVADQSRRVLAAIGQGARTFSNIAKAAGGGVNNPVQAGSLNPILKRLEDKHVVASQVPLAITSGSGGKLYRIDDSYLRLYVSLLASVHEEVKRDRPDIALARFDRRWTTWRGQAIEPVVREALHRSGIREGFRWPDAAAVGSWWPRNFDPEIDIVGADRERPAKKIFYTGSIKWLGTPFDRRDMFALLKGTEALPGAAAGETGTVVVSLSGTADGVDADLVWTPEEVLAAWE